MLAKRQALSGAISLQRSRGDLETLQQDLQGFLYKNSDTPLRSRIQYELARIAESSGEFESAIELYRGVIDQSSDSKNQTWNGATPARARLIQLLLESGAHKDALTELDEFDGDKYASARAHSMLAIAVSFAEAGERPKALEMLAELAQLDTLPEDQLTEFRDSVNYQSALVSSDRGWMRRSIRAVADPLRQALVDKDAKGVAAIANPFVFWAGPIGSDVIHTPYSKIRPAFEEAMRDDASFKVSAGFRESPGRALMHAVLSMDGEQQGHIWFHIVEGPYGWEWKGISYATLNAQPVAKILRIQFTPALTEAQEFDPSCAAPPTPPATAGLPLDALGQPLPADINLLAPWEEGWGMMSGDLEGHGFLPMEGNNACTTVTGWPGFYYGRGCHQGGTNSGCGYHAIDFVKYGDVFGIPYPLGGFDAVAAEAGCVTTVGLGVLTRVRIDHIPCGSFPPAAGYYQSLYLHMGPIYVADGDFVIQGQPLGQVSNQGTTDPHLHFELGFGGPSADFTPVGGTSGSFRSVRPSPLQGLPRGQCGNFACLASLNAFTGRAAGQQCDTPTHCASGLCDGVTQMCIPEDDTGINNDYCTHNNQCANSNCVGASATVGGNCLDAATTIEALCETNAGCDGPRSSRCDDTRLPSMCIPDDGWGQTNEYCTHNNQCANSNCVGVTAAGGGQCAAASTMVGSLCESNAGCSGTRTSRCDDTRLPSMCIPDDATGRTNDYCTHNNHCANSNCVGVTATSGGFCLASSVSIGAACETNAGCAGSRTSRCDDTVLPSQCIPDDGWGLQDEYCTHNNHCDAREGLVCRVETGSGPQPGSCQP